MAKKLRFPLNMNGTDVRTIEELREHFDLESVLGYFANGKLATWLRDRYFDNLAADVEKLDPAESGLNAKLCNILGVEYSAEEDETDLEAIRIRNEKLLKLRQITSDKTIIGAVDLVAFSQDELFDILDEDTEVVYLCGDQFSIPPGRTNIRYVGVNKPLVLLNGSSVSEYENNGISFENTRFEEGTYTPEPEPLIQPFRSCGSYTNKTLVNQMLSVEQVERAEKMYNSIAGDIFNIDFDIDADVHNMKRIINDARLFEVGSRFVEIL